MRRLIIGALVSAIGVAAASSIPAGAQAPSRTPSTASSSKPYTTQKTPWGDPISREPGRATTFACAGPASRRVRHRAELSDAEYAKRLADNREARTRELNRVGAFRNDVYLAPSARPRSSSNRPTADSRSRPRHSKRSRDDSSSAATRPTHGPIAASMTAASRAGVRVGPPGDLRQRQLHFPVAGHRVDHARDGARHANHPPRRTSAYRHGHQMYTGDARGHFEGDTLVVETTNFMGNTTESAAMAVGRRPAMSFTSSSASRVSRRTS